jgi:hypothetical protein
MTVTVTEKVMRIVTVDWAALAAAVREEVIDKLNADMAQWQDDVSMQSMFLRDAADGLYVVALLAEGKWQKAENKLHDMDTASREYVWQWIEKHSCYGLFGVLRDQGS